MLALLVIVYLVRTGLMNCTYPLEESILMDFVPSDTRARWKSLDSISVFGWCCANPNPNPNPSTNPNPNPNPNPNSNPNP